ncbi:MAG TPA: phosphatase PAP2 family protein [Azospira sp.]|nr:phosphatase PAP2 family protein [Azospira sp.]
MPAHATTPAAQAATPTTAPTTLPRRALTLTLIGLLGSAAAIIFLGQYTDLDLILADAYYDPARGLFPWDRTWFSRDFMHGHLKNAIVWFGFLIIGTALVDLAFPLRRLDALRRLQLRFLALAATLEPLLVRSLKDSSNLHCPVAIDLYGGSQPLLRLLDPVPAGWHPGHCFPAGHASAGMWLSALAILWLPRQPRRALAVFAGGLGVGLAMGWVQQMRGMHFLTHTLATAWLSTALLTLLLYLFRQPLLAAVQPRPASGAAAPERSFARCPS